MIYVKSDIRGSLDKGGGASLGNLKTKETEEIEMTVDTQVFLNDVDLAKQMLENAEQNGGNSATPISYLVCGIF